MNCPKCHYNKVIKMNKHNVCGKCGHDWDETLKQLRVKDDKGALKIRKVMRGY